MKKPSSGQVRVGRIENQNEKLEPFKKAFPTFKPCVVLSKSSSYGFLSPFVLKDESGRIIENIWQFSKVYPSVPKMNVRKSQYDNRIIFTSEKEDHVDSKTDSPNEKYWEWRKRGQEAKDPIRYPVGFDFRHTCLYALKDNDKDQKKLDYIQSRKEIYIPIYLNSLEKEPGFQKLKEELQKGKDILILEVDGPREESLPYYMKTYGVDDSFIKNGTMLATKENLKIFLNDETHPFGHGFCLAAALQGIDLLDEEDDLKKDVKKSKVEN